MSPLVWDGGCLPEETDEEELRSTVLGMACSNLPLRCSNVGSEKDSEVSDMVEAEG